MLKVLAKTTQGYNYKYTELADIVKAMAEAGLDYYQYTETDPNTLKDYIWTVIIENGIERKPLRGTEIVMATLQGKSNPAQEMGSSITYARRYSLQMALGWATDDDDAESMTGAKKVETPKFNKLEPITNEKITKVQENKMLMLMRELNLSNEQIKSDMAHFHIEKTDDLTKKQADVYIAELEKRKTKSSVENAIIENAKGDGKNGK